MKELALARRRRLVSHAHLVRTSREDTELALLRLGPAAELAEDVECLGLVGHMCRQLGTGIDVERRGEAAITLMPEALVVALDLGSFGGRAGAAREASDVLLALAAAAG